jgi:hypothetical protein
LLLLLLLLTFHSFKTDTIIAYPVGGMVAKPVELGDVNEVAKPAWNLMCSSSNCKDQRMVNRQLAHHSGQKHLSVKHKTELEEQLVRTKVKKEKQKNVKVMQKTMDTANMLQMVQLYQSFGDEGKAREFIVSIHNGVNKLDMSSEEEGNYSNKENTTTPMSTMMSTLLL